MESSTDVLIVGGGPAGLSTWLHLERLAPALASRCLLIDKATHPRDKLCGGGVTPLADALLRGLGIETTCPSVPVHRIETRFGEQSLVVERPNLFRVVRRSELDHELARVAMARGLDLRQGEALVGLHFEATDVRVVTTGGEYRVAVVVGADGSQSTVRRLIGHGYDPGLARLIDTVLPAPSSQTSPVEQRGALVDFTPVSRGLQGYAWRFPCLDKGCASINVGICDTQVRRALPRADMRAAFVDFLSREGIDCSPKQWRSQPVRWFSRHAVFSQARVLLVGDAAGIDPALGEGIAQSLDYGDLAAQALIDAFEMGDVSFSDYRRRLYQHAVGRTLLARSRLVQRMYAPHPDALGQLQALLLAWLPAPANPGA